MIIKSITIVLAPHQKEIELGGKEGGFIPEERTLVYDREGKRWVAKDGLFPGEIRLAGMIDRVRQDYNG